MRSPVSLVLWVLAFEAVAAFIGITTQSGIDGWYKTLSRPPFVPPDIAFPIVWTALYAMIAVAGWRVFRLPRGRGRAVLCSLFAFYMALNWTWSYVFFSFHQLLAGFVWILVIDMLAGIFVLCAWKEDRIAAWLMVAPLVWTCFAAYLNGAYWLLNR